MTNSGRYFVVYLNASLSKQMAACHAPANELRAGNQSPSHYRSIFPLLIWLQTKHSESDDMFSPQIYFYDVFGIYFLYLSSGQRKPDTDWTKQIVVKRLNFNRQAMITLLPEP